MALTVGGVVIADGDPLTVGGVQVGRVTANGVEVWKDFGGVWSGDSVVNSGTPIPIAGMDTVGEMYRYLGLDPDFIPTYGQPLYLVDGVLAVGTSSVMGFVGIEAGFTTTETTLVAHSNTYDVVGVVTYDPITRKFSGSSFMQSTSGDFHGYETNAEGELRFVDAATPDYGDWIKII